MKKELIFTTLFTLFMVGYLIGQSKMIVGQKHTILVEIPTNSQPTTPSKVPPSSNTQVPPERTAPSRVPCGNTWFMVPGIVYGAWNG